VVHREPTEGNVRSILSAAWMGLLFQCPVPNLAVTKIQTRIGYTEKSSNPPIRRSPPKASINIVYGIMIPASDETYLNEIRKSFLAETLLRV
jgi:hypothetical protein